MPDELSSEREKKIRSAFEKFPFPAYLGMRIERLKYGFARLGLSYKTELSQGQDYIHGGAISALCDSSVAFALAAMIEDGENMLTIELKVNFTAPADGDIAAEARIIHKGKHTAVGEVDVRKSDGTLVAKSVVTYFLTADTECVGEDK